jgi:membrane peptidoglycan carboxypeptidase
MTIRNALAQSRNIPAVKALYLAGVKNSIETAKSMGITSLEDSNRYGLTLVLGGGEVSLLEMVSAYSVFANDGLRNPYNPILRVEDSSGNPIEVHTPFPQRVLSEQTAREINDVLVDPVARAPLYGSGSAASIPGVAIKTGTTNDYRDAWIIGYTPDIVVGAWAGNNDNSPMVKKVSGLVVAPIWRAVMDKITPNLPHSSFLEPEPLDPSLKPILRGSVMGPHSIFYYVRRDDPLGPPPGNPASDSQFSLWEYGVSAWAGTHTYGTNFGPSTASTTTPSTSLTVPTQTAPSNVPIMTPGQTTSSGGGQVPFPSF